MTTSASTNRPYDFSTVRSTMQRYIDNQILPGVSYAIVHNNQVVEQNCHGWADIENDIPLTPDHLFRVFSNTKLVTTIAVFTLLEAGLIQLEDPIEKFIPQLANRQVLNTGATDITDTEPAKSPITIRQLLSHTSGLSYGLLDPGTVMFKAYNANKVLNPATPLTSLVDSLAGLPLSYHPGESWEYSIATDVLGRLIEIVADQPFDQFLNERIFNPLGMTDTAFTLNTNQQERLAVIYQGADPLNPSTPGLTRNDSLPYPKANLQPFPRLSGGGGLVSSLSDFTVLLQSLLPGNSNAALLKSESIRLMMDNQLPADTCVSFPNTGKFRNIGFGLGGAVSLQSSDLDPDAKPGDFGWGGMAGTHWWISPSTNSACLLMTQRYWGFWQPYAFKFKTLALNAITRI